MEKKLFNSVNDSASNETNDTFANKSLYGVNTAAEDDDSNEKKYSTTTRVIFSHTEGYNTQALGERSHAEGRETIAIGNNSHAEGRETIASGTNSHAEGRVTEASNSSSHAGGHYNAAMITGGAVDNTVGHAFVIGNGTSENARSNAFSIMFDGTVKAAKTITASTSADYAEFFEWEDGNPNHEDRVGRFVTLHGDKIALAASQDDYILGIVSGQPFVLGNGDCDTWSGMFLRDDFGRIIYENQCPKLNPAYNPEQAYISRFDRSEWAPVGMLGILSVYDNGSCEVNGYCKCNQDAVAEKSENGYRVIARVSENIIKIILN